MIYLFGDQLILLKLHDNAITTLPDGIGALEKLSKLNLSHNKITSLPKSLFRLRELKQLNLSHNCFSQMDPDLSDLVMLETLVSTYIFVHIPFLIFIY